MKINKVLVASHGTEGARLAERTAIELCRQSNASLHHLLVVPDFWKGMMGDDWLNNAVTQIRFGDYVENQLSRDAASEVDRLFRTCEQDNIPCSSSVRLGKPANCLIECLAEAEEYDLVVIGSPRPKGSPGLRSRMDLELLTRALSIPLVVVPQDPQ
jgi:nucleotide-binding universal stress UspA family protein